MSLFLSLSYTLFNLDLMYHHLKCVYINITNSFVTFLLLYPVKRIKTEHYSVGPCLVLHNIEKHWEIILYTFKHFPLLRLYLQFSQKSFPALFILLKAFAFVSLHFIFRIKYKSHWLGSFLAFMTSIFIHIYFLLFCLKHP